MDPWKYAFSQANISPQASSMVGIGGMPAVAPAPMPYYGQRYNPETQRMDSSEAKSTGFYGPLTNSVGDQVTEYSTEGEINGKNTSFPSVVPGLSLDQLQRLLSASASHQPIPDDIYDVARFHAQQRLMQGLSPFWNTAQDAWPR